MALVLENGVWKLQADSGGVTATTTTVTPGTDVAYTYGGGTLVGAGGALDGWLIQNPGFITRIEEFDGSPGPARIEIDFDFTGAPTNYRWSSVNQCPRGAPAIYLPENVVGNFDFFCEFDAPSTPVTDDQQNFGIAAWNPGDADSTALANIISFGAQTTTSGRYRFIRQVTGGLLGNVSVLSGRAWNTQQFCRLQRVDGEMKGFQKLLDADPWTAEGDEFWDVASNDARLGFAIGSDIGRTGTIRIYQAEATYFPVSVLP
jgi:hypothetical protein